MVKFLIVAAKVYVVLLALAFIFLLILAGIYWYKEEFKR